MKDIRIMAAVVMSLTTAAFCPHIAFAESNTSPVDSVSEYGSVKYEFADPELKMSSGRIRAEWVESASTQGYTVKLYKSTNSSGQKLVRTVNSSKGAADLTSSVRNSGAGTYWYVLKGSKTSMMLTSEKLEVTKEDLKKLKSGTTDVTEVYKNKDPLTDIDNGINSKESKALMGYENIDTDNIRLGWQSTPVGYIYFDENGDPVTSGWRKIDGFWYHFKNGFMEVNSWVFNSDGKYRYVGQGGKMYFNMVTPDGWIVGSDGARVMRAGSVLNGSSYGINTDPVTYEASPGEAVMPGAVSAVSSDVKKSTDPVTFSVSGDNNKNDNSSTEEKIKLVVKKTSTYGGTVYLDGTEPDSEDKEESDDYHETEIDMWEQANPYNIAVVHSVDKVSGTSVNVIDPAKITISSSSSAHRNESSENVGTIAVNLVRKIITSDGDTIYLDRYQEPYTADQAVVNEDHSETVEAIEEKSYNNVSSGPVVKDEDIVKNFIVV